MRLDSSQKLSFEAELQFALTSYYTYPLPPVLSSLALSLVAPLEGRKEMILTAPTALFTLKFLPLHEDLAVLSNYVSQPNLQSDWPRQDASSPFTLTD